MDSRRARNLPNGVQPVVTRHQRLPRLEAQRLEVRNGSRHVRGIADDQIEALPPHRLEPPAVAKLDFYSALYRFLLRDCESRFACLHAHDPDLRAKALYGYRERPRA